MAKKLSARKRAANIFSYLAHPIVLLQLMFCVALVSLAFAFSFPCGRYSYPVGTSCSNGNSFITPLNTILIGLTVGLPIVLLSLSGSKNESQSLEVSGLFPAIINALRRWPKWRKKWYLPVFLLTYLVVSLFIYYFNDGTNLRWYHYIFQYGFDGIALSSFAAYGIVNRLRKVLR